MAEQTKLYTIQQVCEMLGYSPNSTGNVRRMCREGNIGRHLNEESDHSDWVLTEEDVMKLRGRMKRRTGYND